ncbi:MAG: hypothetical protein K2W82_17025 [Candidatus Obscuribacterales bacterium]|nr:hypothetical protein [Candidatus Obscuribacterales bacterium]
MSSLACIVLVLLSLGFFVWSIVSAFVELIAIEAVDNAIDKQIVAATTTAFEEAVHQMFTQPNFHLTVM